MDGLGNSINRVTDDDRITGVRGWLLLPPVLVGLVVLPSFLLLLGRAWSGRLATPGDLIDAIIVVILIVLGGIAILKTFQEKRSAIWLIIVFFVLEGLVSLIVLELYLQQPHIDPLTMVRAFRDVAVAPAMIAYMLTSRRVKLTLVN